MNTLNDLEKHLDRCWKRKNELSWKLKILHDKLDDIVELKEDNVGKILTKEMKDNFSDRIKFLKLTEIYKSIVETCEILGFSVLRDNDGKHKISKA